MFDSTACGGWLVPEGGGEAKSWCVAGAGLFPLACRVELESGPAGHSYKAIRYGIPGVDCELDTSFPTAVAELQQKHRLDSCPWWHHLDRTLHPWSSDRPAPRAASTSIARRLAPQKFEEAYFCFPFTWFPRVSPLPSYPSGSAVEPCTNDAFMLPVLRQHLPHDWPKLATAGPAISQPFDSDSKHG